MTRAPCGARTWKGPPAFSSFMGLDPGPRVGTCMGGKRRGELGSG